MRGELAILNVGDGDTKLVFDDSDPVASERNAKTVRDMIRKGFVLLIEAGRDNEDRPLYRRAIDFDPEAREYIVAGVADEPTTTGAVTHEQESTSQTTRRSKATPAKTAGRKSTERIPASTARAVGVARTAGG